MRSLEEIRDIPFHKLSKEEKKALIADRTAAAEAEDDPRASSVISMAAEVMRKGM